MEAFLKQNEYSIKAIGLVIAAVFALIEYANYRDDLRVEKTIDLYENLYLRNVQPARLSLEKLITSPVTRKQLETLLSVKGGPEEVQKEWQKISIHSLEISGMESAFTDYIEFFDVMQACIDTHICDKDTAKTLFDTNPRDKKITQFYCPYIGYLRAGWQSPDFGEKALQFTDSKCKPSSSFTY
jgi:hypothetical protein